MPPPSTTPPWRSSSASRRMRGRGRLPLTPDPSPSCDYVAGRGENAARFVGAELAPPVSFCPAYPHPPAPSPTKREGEQVDAEPHPWPLSVYGEGKRGRGLRGEVSPAGAAHSVGAELAPPAAYTPQPHSPLPIPYSPLSHSRFFT